MLLKLPRKTKAILQNNRKEIGLDVLAIEFHRTHQIDSKQNKIGNPRLVIDQFTRYKFRRDVFLKVLKDKIQKIVLPKNNKKLSMVRENYGYGSV